MWLGMRHWRTAKEKVCQSLAAMTRVSVNRLPLKVEEARVKSRRTVRVKSLEVQSAREDVESEDPRHKEGEDMLELHKRPDLPDLPLLNQHGRHDLLPPTPV